MLDRNKEIAEKKEADRKRKAAQAIMDKANKEAYAKQQKAVEKAKKEEEKRQKKAQALMDKRDRDAFTKQQKAAETRTRREGCYKTTKSVRKGGNMTALNAKDKKKCDKKHS